MSIDYSARLLQDLEAMNLSELNMGNIFSVCFNLMKTVEGFKGLLGPQKKALVMDAITVFGKKVNAPEFILEGISGFIDIAVSINNGELTLKGVVKPFCSCLPCFSN